MLQEVVNKLDVERGYFRDSPWTGLLRLLEEFVGPRLDLLQDVVPFEEGDRFRGNLLVVDKAALLRVEDLQRLFSL